MRAIRCTYTVYTAVIIILYIIVFSNFNVSDVFIQVLMASEHFIPSKFVFPADYAPVVKNFPMLAALAEACLWPVVLLLFDDQFVPRLSNLYRRRSASERAKPPQGKYCHYYNVLDSSCYDKSLIVNSYGLPVDKNHL